MLQTRSAAGWRFVNPPDTGCSGIWALLLGLESWMIEHSRPFDINHAWNELEQYFNSELYWSDALQLLYSIKTARIEEVTHSVPQYRYFSSLQLKLFANCLTNEYLRGNEEIDLIFLWQVNDNLPEHFFQRWDRASVGSFPINVFLRASRTHYQPLVSPSLSRNLSNADRVFQTKEQNSRRAAPFDIKYNESVPEGEMLLWLMGMINKHPYNWPNPFLTPLSTADLQRMFRIEDLGKIHRDVMTARATWLAKRGAEGLSIDLTNARLAVPTSVPPGRDPTAWRVQNLFAEGRTREHMGREYLPDVPPGGGWLHIPPYESRQMLQSDQIDVSQQQRGHTSQRHVRFASSGRAEDAIAHTRRSSNSQSPEHPSDTPKRGWLRSPYPPFE